ncbi:MAG: Lrp/AsnC family transcriptional regulator [Burkholderiaceae bacterium]|nr:Lrp/AsnC family transcriptional regulator [Burkholderiaceae bacterium]
MITPDLDRIDIQILEALQHDGRATNQALGERVHLSASQVSRRVQRLEEAGLIDRCVTLLRANRVGLTVTAFTRVTLERHGESQNDAFDRAVRLMPEVLECYSVTGPYDYQLRIVSADLESFAQFMMHRLMRLPGVRGVESSVVLQEIKRTTELPLSHVHPTHA